MRLTLLKLKLLESKEIIKKCNAAILSIFQEFKENSKINKAGFNYNRKDDEFLVYVYCPQMDINIKNE